MPPDDKDRLRNRLDERQQAAEESFFAQREKEALRKLREKAAASAVCPSCGASLEPRDGVNACPNGHPTPPR